MKMFLTELNKSFIHTKGWIILFFLIIFQISFYGLRSSDYNYQTEQYKEQYQAYLLTFGGEFDEQKEAKLTAEEERIAQAEKESLQSFQKLYYGEYTIEQYDEDLAAYRNLYEEKMAFQQIQNQYDYARQDADRRYVLYENGWYVALQENNLNFLLIFCVILLSVRVFTPEYETQMYSIIASTGNGKRHTVTGKLMVCLLSAITFGVLTSIICLLSALFKFGLADGKYPLQSISYFSACPYDLTIWQGYLLIWFFKIFALCIISMIAVLCAVALKRSVSAFFVSAIIVVLPYFLFDVNFILHCIPYLGLSVSGLYFRGIEKTVSETEMLQLQSIPLSEILIVYAVGLVLCSICLWSTAKIWNNYPWTWRKRK